MKVFLTGLFVNWPSLSPHPFVTFCSRKPKVQVFLYSSKGSFAFGPQCLVPDKVEDFKTTFIVKTRLIKIIEVFLEANHSVVIAQTYCYRK